MKKTIFALSVTTLIAGIFITRCLLCANKCDKGRDKVRHAMDKLEAAKHDLNRAMQESVQQFQQEADE